MTKDLTKRQAEVLAILQTEPSWVDARGTGVATVITATGSFDIARRPTFLALRQSGLIVPVNIAKGELLPCGKRQNSTRWSMTCWVGDPDNVESVRLEKKAEAEKLAKAKREREDRWAAVVAIAEDLNRLHPELDATPLNGRSSIVGLNGAALAKILRIGS